MRGLTLKQLETVRAIARYGVLDGAVVLDLANQIDAAVQLAQGELPALKGWCPDRWWWVSTRRRNTTRRA